MQDEKDTQHHQQNAQSNSDDAQNQNDAPEAGRMFPNQFTNELSRLSGLQENVTNRNLFHFDGSRYISWLPSFSLQVTNGSGALQDMFRPYNSLSAVRLNEMVCDSKLFKLRDMIRSR